MKHARALAFCSVAAIALMGASVACTPRRESATADLLARKAQCAMQDLTLSPEQMLAKCGMPDSKDVQNLLDIFAGAKVGAANAGAKLPLQADAGAAPTK